MSDAPQRQRSRSPRSTSPAGRRSASPSSRRTRLKRPGSGPSRDRTSAQRPTERQNHGEENRERERGKQHLWPSCVPAAVMVLLPGVPVVHDEESRPAPIEPTGCFPSALGALRSEPAGPAPRRTPGEHAKGPFVAPFCRSRISSFASTPRTVWCMPSTASPTTSMRARRSGSSVRAAVARVCTCSRCSD